jgi:hypothetical protein
MGYKNAFVRAPVLAGISQLSFVNSRSQGSASLMMTTLTFDESTSRLQDSVRKIMTLGPNIDPSTNLGFLFAGVGWPEDDSWPQY